MLYLLVLSLQNQKSPPLNRETGWNKMPCNDVESRSRGSLPPPPGAQAVPYRVTDTKREKYSVVLDTPLLTIRLRYPLTILIDYRTGKNWCENPRENYCQGEDSSVYWM